MGLDVYLLDKATEEASNARQQEWEEIYGRKERGEIDEEEYKRFLDEREPYVPYPQKPSEKYGSDRLFNRNYLRSSYNDGGFNRAVPELIGEAGHDLYWVFADVLAEEEQYLVELTTDSICALEEAKKRALSLAEKLRGAEASLRVDTIDAEKMFGEQPTMTADQALAWYREKAEAKIGSDGWWSSHEGTYMGRAGEEDAGMKVFAAVPGVNVFGHKCVHLIYELSQGTVEHYAQSAEITAEFCDEAIALVEADGAAYMHWSG